MEGGPHILCGKFTTVEGLLQDIVKGLGGSGGNLFNVFGDSRRGKRIESVLSGLADVLSCERQVTLILNDPAGNSFVQVCLINGTNFPKFESFTLEQITNYKGSKIIHLSCPLFSFLVRSSTHIHQ